MTLFIESCFHVSEPGSTPGREVPADPLNRNSVGCVCVGGGDSGGMVFIFSRLADIQSRLSTLITCDLAIVC